MMAVGTNTTLKLCTAAALLLLSPVAVFAQEEQPTQTENGTAPTMQDVLNGLGTNDVAPTSVTDENAAPIEEPATTVPEETGTIETPAAAPPKPLVAESAPNAIPPSEAPPVAPVIENINPALVPAAPAAPTAERAETPPAPPKPPEYIGAKFAELQTLDKVTARTGTMTVPVGETVAIGPLFVQVKTCQQSAPLEQPESAAFLQVWEAKPKDTLAADKDKSPSQWVFSGWMFASSPALSAMDHPIYDIWVLNCTMDNKPAAKTETKTDDKKDAAQAVKSDAKKDASPAKDKASSKKD